MQIDDMTGTNWTTFGTTGTGINQFDEPNGLCIDSSGKIYIADTSNERIVRIDNITGTNWTEYNGGAVIPDLVPYSVFVR